MSRTLDDHQDRCTGHGAAGGASDRDLPAVAPIV